MFHLARLQPPDRPIPKAGPPLPSPLRREWRAGILLLASALLLSPSSLSGLAFIATIEVDDVSGGSNPVNGKCSLREAITNVNNGNAATTFLGECEAGDGVIGNRIVFDPSVFGAGATIAPTSTQGALPPITRSFTTIDGWSAGGAGYTGPPLVTLDGSGLVGSSQTVRGLELQSNGNLVRGLAITGFDPTTADGYGIEVKGDDNHLRGNYIGVEADGATAAGNGTGVVVSAAVSGTLIGSNSDGVDDPAERNLVGGNGVGILLVSTVATIRGNSIGVDDAGLSPLPNGVGIHLDAQNTAAEGLLVEDNLVSGNGLWGILIQSCPSAPCTAFTSGHRIRSNVIGLGADDSTELPNRRGIYLDDTPDNVVADNVLSGNMQSGLRIEGAPSTGNWITRNRIGPTATFSATQQGYGVRLAGAGGNRIEDNLIGGNMASQIRLTTLTGSPDGTVILRNRIGSTPDGDPIVKAGGIELEAGTGTLVADNDLRHLTEAIRIAGSGGAKIFRNLVRDNDGPGDVGVLLEESGVLLSGSTDNCLHNNDSGVQNGTGSGATFEHDWWGDASGPSGAGSGSGDSVDANIDYTPWLTSRPICGLAGSLFIDGFESGATVSWSAASP